VIFLPLTLATRPRDVRAPIVACSVAALAWLPFVVGAPDSLKALRPTVHLAPDSVLTIFGVTDDSIPGWLGVAELVACIAVASALV
jgi:hypothetical protein